MYWQPERGSHQPTLGNQSRVHRDVIFELVFKIETPNFSIDKKALG